ncbi:MAG: methylated-DNA--[protein]-cysteine S-methyltransferase [Vulcanimicrobiota bacterium]
MKTEIMYNIIDTSIGRVVISSLKNKILNVSLKDPELKKLRKFLSTNFINFSLNFETDNSLLNHTGSLVVQFLKGSPVHFDVPVDLKGTDFQLQVWNEIKQVSRGTIITYGHIARRLGKPRSGRAVGGACNRNPVPLIIPCHRVLGKNRKLVGFGSGIDVKRKLLELENIVYNT